MCCVVTVLLFLGPRFADILWWILQPDRWNESFGRPIWAILGIVFLPWTSLIYVAVWNPISGISLLGWVLIVFGVFADIAVHGGGGFFNRKRVPGYGS
jgi:hypothetical protein